MKALTLAGLLLSLSLGTAAAGDWQGRAGQGAWGRGGEGPKHGDWAAPRHGDGRNGCPPEREVRPDRHPGGEHDAWYSVNRPRPTWGSPMVWGSLPGYSPWSRPAAISVWE
jgi:hypothetical protein